MKQIKLLVIAFFLSVFLFSCQNNKTTKPNEAQNNVTKSIGKTKEKLSTVEVTIEGMTCQIGCARLIQSKISKENGVQYANVDFKSKKGVFTYNENLISEEDIVLKINKIADGELYSVSSKKQLDTIFSKK